MILFKAIRHIDKSILSSTFQGEYRTHSCLSELINSAIGHIKIANQKRINRSSDYWFSAINVFNTAWRYLSEHSDEYGYNGIACIELPNTEKSGYIYDDSLRENGYIDKEKIGNEFKCIWKPNDDGIVWILDMLDETTINYLASILWLKGNASTFRDLRVLRTSNKDHEFLILGENIKYKFIDSGMAKKYQKQFYSVNYIYNWHTELFQLFVDHAPDSNNKKIIREMSKELCIRKKCI